MLYKTNSMASDREPKRHLAAPSNANYDALAVKLAFFNNGK